MTAGLALTLGSCMALAADEASAPTVPDNLQVPEGNELFLTSQAVGTQNYVCLPSGTGFAWTFFSPQATVFHKVKWSGGDVSRQIITHFLSMNPDEGGTARVTWQSSSDSSAVWGRAMQTSNDPNIVAAGAIPWVLLQVVGAQKGPAGGDSMTYATFIQRLNTAGGVAPSSGCSQASNVGATALMPYTADYLFFRPVPKN